MKARTYCARAGISAVSSTACIALAFQCINNMRRIPALMVNGRNLSIRRILQPAQSCPPRKAQIVDSKPHSLDLRTDGELSPAPRTPPGTFFLGTLGVSPPGQAALNLVNTERTQRHKTCAFNHFAACTRDSHAILHDLRRRWGTPVPFVTLVVTSSHDVMIWG